MAFRVLIIGSTGQVGAAVVRALLAEPSCAEVVMVNRRATPLAANDRLRQVILDMAAAQFPAEGGSGDWFPFLIHNAAADILASIQQHVEFHLVGSRRRGDF